MDLDQKTLDKLAEVQKKDMQFLDAFLSDADSDVVLQLHMYMPHFILGFNSFMFKL